MSTPLIRDMLHGGGGYAFGLQDPFVPLFYTHNSHLHKSHLERQQQQELSLRHGGEGVTNDKIDDMFDKIEQQHNLNVSREKRRRGGIEEPTTGIEHSTTTTIEPTTVGKTIAAGADGLSEIESLQVQLAAEKEARAVVEEEKEFLALRVEKMTFEMQTGEQVMKAMREQLVGERVGGSPGDHSSAVIKVLREQNELLTRSLSEARRDMATILSEKEGEMLTITRQLEALEAQLPMVRPNVNAGSGRGGDNLQIAVTRAKGLANELAAEGEDGPAQLAEELASVLGEVFASGGHHGNT